MGDQYDEHVVRLSAILKGLVLSFAFLIVGSLVLGFIVSLNDSIADDVTNRFLMVLNYTAIFIGGVMGARWAHTKGWLHGGLVGLIYMVIVIFIGSRYAEVAVGFEILLRITSGLLTGALGGVFGVNVK